MSVCLCWWCFSGSLGLYASSLVNPQRIRASDLTSSTSSSTIVGLPSSPLPTPAAADGGSSSFSVVPSFMFVMVFHCSCVLVQHLLLQVASKTKGRMIPSLALCGGRKPQRMTSKTATNQNGHIKNPKRPQTKTAT